MVLEYLTSAITLEDVIAAAPAVCSNARTGRIKAANIFGQLCKVGGVRSVGRLKSQET
jgi:hypothetical protein